MKSLSRLAVLSSPILKETILFAGFLLAGLFAFSFLPDLGFAASLIDESDNIDAVADLTGGETDLKSLINTILSYFLGFLGFVCVIMVIYGGILYVTSAGNDENVGKAKKILLYAAIGIVLIMISFALVNTLLGAGLGGGNVTTGVAQ